MQKPYRFAMATPTVVSSEHRNQSQEISQQPFGSKSHSFTIDGQGSKFQSALQVVTEALSSTDNVLKHASSRNSNQVSVSLISSPSNNLLQPGQNHRVQGLPTTTVIINQPTHSSEPTSFESQLPERAQDASLPIAHISSSDSLLLSNEGEMLHPQGGTSTATGKTIVSPDSDVSNGFVKDGKMLPYVFEANEAGKYLSFFVSSRLFTNCIRILYC